MKNKLNRKAMFLMLLALILVVAIPIYINSIRNSATNGTKKVSNKNGSKGSGKVQKDKNGKINNSATINEDKIPEKYKYKKVIEQNYIVKIVEGNKVEVTDMSKLKKFKENIKNKKNDKLFIIEYLQKDSIRTMNYLIEMEIEGDKVKFVKYQTNEKGELKVKHKSSFVEIAQIGDNHGAKVIGRENKLQELKDGYTILSYQESQTTESR